MGALVRFKDKTDKRGRRYRHGVVEKYHPGTQRYTVKPDDGGPLEVLEGKGIEVVKAVVPELSTEPKPEPINPDPAWEKPVHDGPFEKGDWVHPPTGRHLAQRVERVDGDRAWLIDGNGGGGWRNIDGWRLVERGDPRPIPENALTPEKLEALHNRPGETPGTRVTTWSRVKVGDWVATPDGPQKVVGRGKTNEGLGEPAVEFENGELFFGRDPGDGAYNDFDVYNDDPVETPAESPEERMFREGREFGQKYTAPDLVERLEGLQAALDGMGDEDPPDIVPDLPESKRKGARVLSALGFTGVPKQVPREELDRYRAQGVYQLFRGVEDPQFAQSQLHGGPYYPGNGMMGSATYFAFGPNLAQNYLYKGGVVSRAVVAPDARVLNLAAHDQPTQNLIMNQMRKAIADAGYGSLVGYDGAAMLGAHGYDAVVFHQDETNAFAILNRGKLIVGDTDYTYDEVQAGALGGYTADENRSDSGLQFQVPPPADGSPGQG